LTACKAGASTAKRLSRFFEVSLVWPGSAPSMTDRLKAELRTAAAAVLITALMSLPAWSQDKVFDKSSDKSITGKTAGMRKIARYMPLYLDEAGGRLLMEISRFQKEFLYQVSLPAGVGSNPLGLDRGQLGNTRIVYFERAGPKVLMISPNYRYRALGGGA